MDGVRARAFAGVAFLIGFGAGIWLLVAFGFVDIWQHQIFGSDLSGIWAGPRILVTGGDPYDPVTFGPASEALGAQPSATTTYIYPGWVALLLAPLGLLDLEQAALVWIALGVGLGAAGIFVLMDVSARRLPLAHTLVAFTFVGSESGIVAFYSGQFDLLLVGLLALMAAALWTGRPRAAGILAGAMLLKPQLFTLAAPALLWHTWARGERRYAYSFGATAIALAAASTLAMPHWWTAWLSSVPAARAADPRATTLPNAMGDVLGPAGTVAAYLILGATVLAAFAISPRSRAAVPVWLAVSLAVAPYQFVYDHVLGIVPLALVVALWGAKRRRRADVIASIGALTLTVGATLVHAFPGVEHATLSYEGFTQFALTLLVVVGAWPFRKGVTEVAKTA